MWHWSEFVRGTAIGTLGLILCICIEFAAPIERYTLRQRIPGAIMQYGGAWIGFAIVGPVQNAWMALGLKPYLIPLWSLLKPLGWYGVALETFVVLLAWDFLRYWRHRAEHKWFWPIHAVHHSPNELHAVNSIGHPLQGFIELAFVTIPMSFVQFSGPDLTWALGSLVGFLNLYIHCPAKANLGPLRHLIVDPRFHRIHHSLEPRHFDRNFSIVFSVWDWLFGTAYLPRKDEWPAVGVAGVPAPHALGDFLAMPLRILRSSGERGRTEAATQFD